MRVNKRVPFFRHETWLAASGVREIFFFPGKTADGSRELRRIGGMISSGESLESDDGDRKSPRCARSEEKEREEKEGALWIYKIIPRNGGNKSLVS